MQLIKITLNRNTNINFGAKMKRKHFTLLHMWLLFFVEAHSAKADFCLRPPIGGTLHPKEMCFNAELNQIANE